MAFDIYYMHNPERFKDYERRIAEAQAYKTREETADGICEACGKYHALKMHEEVRSPQRGQFLCPKCLDWAIRGDDIQEMVDPEPTEYEEHG